jgi:CBS-domain-containing membrane protein
MAVATKPFQLLTAADLMSRELILIPREMSLRTASRLLAQGHVSGAPVVDADRRCIGVLSVTDLAYANQAGELRKQEGCDAAFHCAWQFVEIDNLPADRVDAYMSKDPVIAEPGVSIVELARMMMDAHIHRVIVVNAQRQAIGIVSSTDILAAVARFESSTPARPDGEVHCEFRPCLRN